jgi:hypothetical protein
MSDIFEGYVDWSLNRRFGGAPMIEEEAKPQLLSNDPENPIDVGQPEFTKPGVVNRMVVEGLESLKSDIESKPIESAYGLAKGAVQGTIGSVGDIVSIAKGIYYATQTPEGQSKVEEFIKGMESATGAPTADDVKNFLNKYLPSGTKSTETVGEVVSLGKVVGKAVKEISKVTSKNKGKVAAGSAASASTQASKEKAK